MSREILFRGKRIDNGEWVEGDYITNERDTSKAYIGYLFDVRNGVIEDFDIVEVIPTTVCQYTGLTDKNGKKIFDNDIIAVYCCANCGRDMVQYGYAKIFWSEYWSCWKKNIYRTFENGFTPSTVEINKNNVGYTEVIGNIFDNSELLNNSSDN